MNNADAAILDHFKDIRGKTIKMLGVVGTELLGRTVEGENKTLGRQFAHIPNGLEWWMHHVMGDGLGHSNDHPSGKDAIGEHLAASRDRLVNFFAADDGQPMGLTYTLSRDMQPEGDLPQWVGRTRVLYLTAHELHHLGRIELGLWQLGLTDLPDFP